MATVLVVLLVVASVGSVRADAILFEERLDKLLGVGYCQASAQQGLEGDQCEQKRQEDTKQLIFDKVTNCLYREDVKTEANGYDLLDELSKSTTWQTMDTVKAFLVAYFRLCVNSESSPASKYAAPNADPCTSPRTRNLTEWWRQDDEGSNIQPIKGTYNCDKDLQNNKTWFRFQGAAGTHLQTTCVPSLSCGSHGGFWSDAEMPTAVGETRQVHIHGSLYGNCKRYSWPTNRALTVKRCSQAPHDLVYKIYGTEDCYWSVCGTE